MRTELHLSVFLYCYEEENTYQQLGDVEQCKAIEL
jgi:hypothetical protein